MKLKSIVLLSFALLASMVSGVKASAQQNQGPDIYEQVPIHLENAFKEHSGYSMYTMVINNTAGIMIILPLVIIYLFCQRYLVQGIERSGLVG